MTPRSSRFIAPIIIVSVALTACSGVDDVVPAAGFSASQQAISAAVATVLIAVAVWLWRRRVLHRTLERTIADRTRDLELARREAELANQATGEVWSVVSHDIRSPLSGILGYADLLACTDQSAKQEEFTAGIRQSTLNLVDLVNDLATTGRGLNQLHSLPLEPASVFSLANESISDVHPSAWHAGVTVRSVMDPRLASLHLIAARHLRRVLVNLMSHAIVHSRGRSVELSCTVAAENAGVSQTVVFAVTDDGGTLDPDQVEAVFERGLRGRNASGDRSGLGLAISREFVALQGGELKVSVEPGVSTRFEFELVLTRADTQPAKPQGAAEVVAAPTVYVVDDERPVRTVIAALFRDLGWSVRTFPGALEALEAIVSERPTLVSTDIVMEPLSGIDLAIAIRHQAHDAIGLLAVTGEPNLARESALFDRVITKPASRRELSAAIRSIGMASQPNA